MCEPPELGCVGFVSTGIVPASLEIIATVIAGRGSGGTAEIDRTWTQRRSMQIRRSITRLMSGPPVRSFWISGRCATPQDRTRLSTARADPRSMQTNQPTEKAYRVEASDRKYGCDVSAKGPIFAGVIVVV